MTRAAALKVLHGGHEHGEVRPGRQPSQRAAEWAALEACLAKALACLEDGHFLTVTTRDEDSYYVQFAAEGAEGMRAEAVSNRFLDGWRRLDRIAEDRLRRLGWRPATEVGDGPVNWWRSFGAPVPTAEVASLAVATLTKAFDVPRTAWLTYRAFTRDGAEIFFPDLGIGHRHEPAALPELAERVDAAMRSYLGADELVYDDDGDIPFRSDDAMIYVRSVPDAGFFTVFSPFLRGVPKSYGLLDAVNTINLEVRTARAVLSDSGVSIAADIDDGPDLEAAVVRACNGISALANQFGERLQAQFGGATFFQEPAAHPPTTGTGLYL